MAGKNKIKRNVMKKKSKIYIANNSAELASLLKLPHEYAVKAEMHSALTKKIIAEVKKQNLTHVQVATLAKASRARITQILNHGNVSVSIELLLRILSALGYDTKISFQKRKNHRVAA